MEDLVRIFKSLADPVRLRLVGMLAEGERCGRELASELGVSPPTVSHHLKLLREAGLLTERRENKYVFYKLDFAPLRSAAKRVANRREVAELAAGPGLAAEKRKVLESFFSGDRLLQIPAQRRKKELVFEEILRRLPKRKEYGERELSDMIEKIHSDFCTIRREFIMGGYMERKSGRYRLTARGHAARADGARP